MTPLQQFQNDYLEFDELFMPDEPYLVPASEYELQNAYEAQNAYESDLQMDFDLIAMDFDLLPLDFD